MIQRLCHPGGRPLRSGFYALCLLVAASCATATARSTATQLENAGATSGTLVLMGTTDVHGWLLPYDYFTGEEVDFGLSRLAPIIDSIRGVHPGRTMLVDSGDLLQGNPLAFVYSELGADEVHPIVHAMNLLEYDAAALGNHEFNFGIEHLDRTISRARFPFLSANTFRHGTQEHAYTPYAIVEREVEGRPLRIGITSATPPGVHVWDKDHVESRLEFRDIVESIRPLVTTMRQEGADLVVVAAHSGLEGTSYDTASTGLPPENVMGRLPLEVPGIDVIFLGHTHRELADTTIGNTLVLQARNWARSLAVAEFELRAEPGRGWQVMWKKGQVIRASPAVRSARFDAELQAAHRRTLDYVNRPIGVSRERWTAERARVRATPIIDFVNEVQRHVAGTQLSATSAFNLSAAFPEGPITVADVARLYIYDNNTLRAVRITGAQLRAFLEKSAEYYLPCPALACERVTNPEVPGYNFDIVSGVDYTLDVRRPLGERVTRLEYQGRAVEPTDTFTMALNNYRQGGGGGFTMVSEAPVVYDRDESIRDLLIQEIERRGSIAPQDYFRDNWRLVPETLAERAVAEQTAGGAPR